MTSDFAIDGASIQACAAADTAQRLAIFAGKNFSAPVIEENDVEFFRPIFLLRLARPAKEARIDGERLPRSAARQKLEHHRQIGKSRDQLLNADQAHKHAR